MGHHGSHPRPRLGAAALLAVVAACSSANTPATTPTTTEAPSTTASTAAPATTTTTEAVASDRLAEIQAIFQDLEERRLDALYRGDVEAFKALFANEAYMELDLESLELVVFDEEPRNHIIRVEEILIDLSDCIAIRAFRDFKAFFGPTAETSSTVVLELSPQGWGYSFEYAPREGWACEGPHPLSG